MKKYILAVLLVCSLFLVVGAGILDLLVFETNCADNTKGICVDTDDWKMYRWNPGTSAMVAFIDTTTLAANETDPLSPHKYTDASDPAVTDDITEGFLVGDVWLGTTSGAWYICSDNTDGAAVWDTMGSIKEKTVSDAETITENYMQKYVLHNTGATGTIEITLDTPVRYCYFWVTDWAGQTIEIDFPADANPYLDEVQVGANNEIDVPSGARLFIEYRPGDGTWHTFRVFGLADAGGADD